LPRLAQNYVDITIGGKFIMRLRAGYGNLTVQERARIVEERLVEALGERLREDQITLKEVRKDAQYEIYVRGRLLITVTQADADAAKMSVKQARRTLAQATAPHAARTQRATAPITTAG
jgi:hypothetical protein